MIDRRERAGGGRSGKRGEMHSINLNNIAMSSDEVRLIFPFEQGTKQRMYERAVGRRRVSIKI